MARRWPVSGVVCLAAAVANVTISRASTASSAARAAWLFMNPVCHGVGAPNDLFAMNRCCCSDSVDVLRRHTSPGRKRHRSSTLAGRGGAYNQAPSAWAAGSSSHGGRGMYGCWRKRGGRDSIFIKNGLMEKSLGDNSLSYFRPLFSIQGEGSDDEKRAKATTEQLLVETLDMSDNEAQEVTARCGELQAGVAGEVLTFFCAGGLDLTVHQMRELVLKTPRVLEMSVVDSLAPQVDWWLRRAGLTGLTRKALGRMATKCPEVVLLSSESVLAPMILWLLVEIKMSRNSAAKFLESYPQLLARDLDSELKPRHGWLTSYFGLQTKDIRKIVTFTPQVLHASLEETLLPACDWLARTITERGCDVETSRGIVGSIVARSPELLLSPPDAMEECFIELAEVLFQDDRQQAAALLERQPVLLSSSYRVSPLVTFITHEMRATLAQAREVIANDVTLLEFDFEGRVFPRLDAIREAGIGDVVTGATSPLTLSAKMKVLGRFSDARFVKWLARETVPVGGVDV